MFGHRLSAALLLCSMTLSKPLLIRVRHRQSLQSRTEESGDQLERLCSSQHYGVLEEYGNYQGCYGALCSVHAALQLTVECIKGDRVPAQVLLEEGVT